MSYRNNESSSSYTERNNSEECHKRHPKHLRGRDIGLWYAKRNKQRKLSDEDIQNYQDNKKNKEEKVVKFYIVILISINLNLKSFLQVAEICLLNQRRKDIYHILSMLEDEKNQVKNINFKRKFLKITNNNIDHKYTENVHTHINNDDMLNKILLDELRFKTENNREYDNLFKTRKKLPCFKQKDDILDAIWNNQITLISGETGSGKTTQIPQFILDKFILDGIGSQAKIICTQPRRISAISVCERVADERVEKVGTGSIGYQIRLEKYVITLTLLLLSV